MVTEIPTSQEIQVVKRRVAQRTTGEARRVNGRSMILKRLSWELKPE
jgi:hypothetical protein